MRFWNFVETENGRELRLDGAISDETWYGDEITPKQFRAELNAGTGDITVWLNSPGGDVFAAAEIYNSLRAYRGKVTILIDSLAASAASFLAMAGDEIQISPVGMMMIHNPETIAAGNVAEFQSVITTLNEVKESIINAYELKTKLPRKKISELMDEETWLNARRAVELGFADKIIGDSGGLKAQQFSRIQITNSFVAKFKPEKPPADKGGGDVSRLRRRIFLGR